MGNVLDEQQQHDVRALGRQGWTLSRIAAATRVHRVTAGEYLRAAGIPVRGRGRPREGTAKPTISPPEVSTDSPANPAMVSAGSTDAAPARAPTASACEIYREVITEACARGRNAMAIWQDLVDDHGFHRAVRERPALRPQPARDAHGRGARRHHDRARRRSPGRLRRRADGARPGDGQIQTHAPVCPDARLLAQSRAAAGVAIERPGLGRAARAGVSPARRHRDGHHPRQSERGRPHARRLRPGAQSALSRRARALRRRRAAVSRRRSRSQRQSRSGHRPHAEDAAARACASRRWRRRRPISIAGRRAGPTHAFTARRNAKSP